MLNNLERFLYSKYIINMKNYDYLALTFVILSAY